jgi:hypothetical protein
MIRHIFFLTALSSNVSSTPPVAGAVTAVLMDMFIFLKNVAFDHCAPELLALRGRAGIGIGVVNVWRHRPLMWPSCRDRS